jgi:hypothetical protein
MKNPATGIGGKGGTRGRVSVCQFQRLANAQGCHFVPKEKGRTVAYAIPVTAEVTAPGPLSIESNELIRNQIVNMVAPAQKAGGPGRAQCLEEAFCFPRQQLGFHGPTDAL